MRIQGGESPCTPLASDESAVRAPSTFYLAESFFPHLKPRTKTYSSRTGFTLRPMTRLDLRGRKCSVGLGARIARFADK